MQQVEQENSQEQPNIDIPLTPELPQNDALAPEVPMAPMENTQKEVPPQDAVEQPQEQVDVPQTDISSNINIPLFANGMPTPQTDEQPEI